MNPTEREKELERLLAENERRAKKTERILWIAAILFAIGLTLQIIGIFIGD